MGAKPVMGLATLVGVLVLAVTACGGDEDADSTTTSPAEANTTNVGSEPTTTVSEPGPGLPEMTDTDWNVTHYASEIWSGVTNVWPDTEVTLRLGADGTITGNAGCNDYNGTYELSGPYVIDPEVDEERGQAIAITELTWTEMLCESENLMEQETEYLDVLLEVEYWSMGQGFGEGESLLLRSQDDGLLVEAAPAG